MSQDNAQRSTFSGADDVQVPVDPALQPANNATSAQQSTDALHRPEQGSRLDPMRAGQLFAAMYPNIIEDALEAGELQHSDLYGTSSGAPGVDTVNADRGSIAHGAGSSQRPAHVQPLAMSPIASDVLPTAASPYDIINSLFDLDVDEKLQLTAHVQPRSVDALDVLPTAASPDNIINNQSDLDQYVADNLQYTAHIQPGSLNAPNVSPNATAPGYHTSINAPNHQHTIGSSQHTAYVQPMSFDSCLNVFPIATTGGHHTITNSRMHQRGTIDHQGPQANVKANKFIKGSQSDKKTATTDGKDSSPPVRRSLRRYDEDEIRYILQRFEDNPPRSTPGWQYHDEIAEQISAFLSARPGGLVTGPSVKYKYKKLREWVEKRRIEKINGRWLSPSIEKRLGLRDDEGEAEEDQRRAKKPRLE